MKKFTLAACMCAAGWWPTAASAALVCDFDVRVIGVTGSAQAAVIDAHHANGRPGDVVTLEIWFQTKDSDGNPANNSFSFSAFSVRSDDALSAGGILLGNLAGMQLPVAMQGAGFRVGTDTAAAGAIPFDSDGDVDWGSNTTSNIEANTVFASAAAAPNSPVAVAGLLKDGAASADFLLGTLTFTIAGGVGHDGDKATISVAPKAQTTNTSFTTVWNDGATLRRMNGNLSFNFDAAGGGTQANSFGLVNAIVTQVPAPVPVPEPATIVLAAMGAIGLCLTRNLSSGQSKS